MRTMLSDTEGMKKSRKKDRPKQFQRDYNRITKNDYLLKELTKRSKYYNDYTEVMDRRRNLPGKASISRRIDGTNATLTTTLPDQRSPGFKDYTLAKVSFQDPRRVVVCRRRKNRREILFKMGKVGKGKKVSRIRRRNIDSDIKC